MISRGGAAGAQKDRAEEVFNGYTRGAIQKKIFRGMIKVQGSHAF